MQLPKTWTPWVVVVVVGVGLFTLFRRQKNHHTFKDQARQNNQNMTVLSGTLKSVLAKKKSQKTRRKTDVCIHESYCIWKML
jgi:hypothetical protein